MPSVVVVARPTFNLPALNSSRVRISRGTCWGGALPILSRSKGAPGPSTFYALKMQLRDQSTERAGDEALSGHSDQEGAQGCVAVGGHRVFCVTKKVAEYSSKNMGFEPDR